MGCHPSHWLIFFKMVKTTTNQIWLPVLTPRSISLPSRKTTHGCGPLLRSWPLRCWWTRWSWNLGNSVSVGESYGVFSFWPSKSRDGIRNILKPWEVFALFWLFHDFMAPKPQTFSGTWRGPTQIAAMLRVQGRAAGRPLSQNSLVATNLGIHSFFVDHSVCFHEKPWQVVWIATEIARGYISSKNIPIFSWWNPYESPSNPMNSRKSQDFCWLNHGKSLWQHGYLTLHAGKYARRVRDSRASGDHWHCPSGAGRGITG